MIGNIIHDESSCRLCNSAAKVHNPHWFRNEDQFYTHQIVRKYDKNTLIIISQSGALNAVSPSALI
jgi:hypothetical protein